MAFSFENLKKRRLNDDNPGKEKFRDKNEEDDDFIVNPFRKAKKGSYDEETDTVPVDDEGSEIEELTEGEAGHTAEKKMVPDDNDHADETDLFSEEEEADEEHPTPRKRKPESPRKKFDSEEASEDPYEEAAEGPGDEEKEPIHKKKGYPPKKKAGPSFSFRRML